MKISDRSAPDLTPPDPIQTSIDTVVAGLRETQSSPGLERRLLSALASRPATSTRSGRDRPWLWSAAALRLTPRAAAAASTLAAVLLLSIAFLYQHHQPATATPATTSPANSRAPSSLASNKAPWPSGSRSAERKEYPQISLSHRTKRHELITSVKAMASSNSHRASYPAPPMPLTEQEKLLLRVAHSASPQQSVVVDPNLQARAEDAAATEFQLFFIAATTIRNQEPPPD